jgi:hypothetical protein
MSENAVNGTTFPIAEVRRNPPNTLQHARSNDFVLFSFEAHPEREKRGSKTSLRVMLKGSREQSCRQTSAPPPLSTKHAWRLTLRTEQQDHGANSPSTEELRL